MSTGCSAANPYDLRIYLFSPRIGGKNYRCCWRGRHYLRPGLLSRGTVGGQIRSAGSRLADLQTDARSGWSSGGRTTCLLRFCRCGRGEMWLYGGRQVSFLSLPDLIRSKETEREFDWQDVNVLEEFLDARNLARWKEGNLGASSALSAVRSRTGLEALLRAGLLNDTSEISQILSAIDNPITQALLLPFAPTAALADAAPALETVVVNRLRATVPGSPLHLALFAAARRQYRAHHQNVDKRDKEAIRRSQNK